MRKPTITTSLELTPDDRQLLERIAEEKQVSLSAVARWILAEYRALQRHPLAASESGTPAKSLQGLSQ